MRRILFKKARDFDVILTSKGKSYKIKIKGGTITQKNIGAKLGGDVKETINAESIKIKEVIKNHGNKKKHNKKK